jgi:hypothetical protein
MSLATLVWTLLLGAPVAGFVLQRLAAETLTPRRYAMVAAILAGFIVLVIGACMLDIRFVPILPNVLVPAAAYVAYVFLLFSIRKLPWPPTSRAATFLIAGLPVALGYFLGTVGGLGVLFIAGEYAKPRQFVKLEANMVCTQVEGGGPSGGYALHIHREWPLAPLLHRKVRTLSFKNAGESCEGLRGRSL